MLQAIILCPEMIFSAATKWREVDLELQAKRFDGIKKKIPQHHFSKSKKRKKREREREKLLVITDNVTQGQELHSSGPKLHLGSGRQTTTGSISGLFVRLEHSTIHLSHTVYQRVL